MWSYNKSQIYLVSKFYFLTLENAEICYSIFRVHVIRSAFEDSFGILPWVPPAPASQFSKPIMKSHDTLL